VIFATVGSTQIRFDRFICALETLSAEQLFVQHGPMAAPAGADRAVAYMQFPEVVESMEQADTVVCHAGAGSILCALRAGHTPVVMPRLKRFEETVDDHQVEFSRALAAQGKVIAVEDPDLLRVAVASAPRRRSPQEQTALRPIQVAVREALRGAPA
jgi:UDP-N-acetylglucosamine transferase subunit ALG13